MSYLDLDGAAPPPPHDVISTVSWPRSEIGGKVFEQIYQTTDLQDALLRYESAPGFAVHPVLDYITAPISNTHYRIGAEGIRYQPGWSDDYVRGLLSGGAPLIFAFGGSTMLGHGVSGNHTIPYFMNARLGKSGAIVLNFGSQAYDQHREIENLVYLLRSGFRPRAVIFLDGWNDMFTMARRNMRVQDKIIYHGFAGGRGVVAFTPSDSAVDKRSLRLALEALPLYRWLLGYRRRNTGLAGIATVRDAFTDGFDFREAAYVHANWAEFGDRNLDLLKKQMLLYYRRNLALLKGLAAGFDFDLYAYYQPIGLFDEDNPFVDTEAASKARGYDFLAAMKDTVTKAIASGALDMTDIGQLLENADFQKYLDVAHYSPRANDLIARRIAADLNAK